MNVLKTYFLIIVVLITIITGCFKKQVVTKTSEQTETTTEIKPTVKTNKPVELKEPITAINTDVPKWSKDAIMYEVNIRQYSPEGTFKAVEKDLDRIKKLGVDILWLMPIHPIGDAKRKGSLGSYYAVKDYKAVNPGFGTLQDFKDLVEACHAIDLKLIIDWVPNHTAWDNPWITENPSWYTQDEDGNIIDPTNPETGESWGWTDVADLNYDNSNMRAAMLSAMKFWVAETNIDGFRCDVAHNVPFDFWHKVNAELKQIKPIFMLAEAEGTDFHKNGFHQTYAWELHHLLNEVAKGEKPVNEIASYLTKNEKEYGKAAYRLNFITNHDENSWSGTIFERMGGGHKAFAALTYLIPGMPLIYNGQEAPLKKRLEFFEKDAIDWNNYAYTEFYQKLNMLKKANAALWNGAYGGDFVLIDNTTKNMVLSFERTHKNGNKVLAVFNLTNKTVKTEIKNDLFVKRNKSSHVELTPFEYLVFSTNELQ